MLIDEVEFLKLDKNDLPLLLNLKNESWFATHQTSFLNLDDQENWFNNLDSKHLVLMASLKEQSKFGIFKIVIDWLNRKADVGWDVIVDYRGLGYGKKLVTEGVRLCFECLNLHRLDAEILENNIASLKCALTAGFVEEGRKRWAIFKGGQYLDSIVLGCINQLPPPQGRK